MKNTFEHEQPAEEIGPEPDLEGADAKAVADMDSRSAEAVIEGLKAEGWSYVGPAEAGTDVYGAVKHGKEVQIKTVDGQRVIFERDEEPEV